MDKIRALFEQYAQPKGLLLRVQYYPEKDVYDALTTQAAYEAFKAGRPRELRFTHDGALAECPCCGSLDVGGAGQTVHCQHCGLQLHKEGPLQNAIDAWNTRAGAVPAPVELPAEWKDTYEIIREQYGQYANGDPNMPFSEIRNGLDQLFSDTDDMIREVDASQPAPAEPEEWTDAQCVEFMCYALRHVEFEKGTKGPTADDIRLGVRMALSDSTQTPEGIDPILKELAGVDEIGRKGDMGPDQVMRVGFDGDRDIYVVVSDEEAVASLEFCTIGTGGGRSPHTRKALVALMKAMRKDNLTDPSRDFHFQRNKSAG